MRVTFDSKKDAINIRKHGISLQRAADFDLHTAEFKEDTSQDYGENRYSALGWLDARLHVLVFTQPGESHMHAISLRKADSFERKNYAEVF